MSDIEDKVIDAVYKRNALWDPTNPFKKQPRMLTLLWKEVEKEVGISAKTAKKKWKNLRGYYLEMLRKKELAEIETPNNDTQEDIVKWSRFSKMNFLKDTLSLHKNETKKDNDENDDSENANSPIPISISVKVECDPLDTSLKTQKDQMPKKKNKEVTDNNQVLSVDEILEMYDITEGSEHYTFFKNLIPSLRKLNPLQKLAVKSEIYRLILEAIFDGNEF